VRALNRLSLRLRLTLAFAGAAAVLLAGIGTFVVLRVQAGLDGELDHALRLRAGELAERAGDLRRVGGIIDAAGQPAQVLDGSGRVLASVRVHGAVSLLNTPARLAAAQRGEVIFERRERTRVMARPAGADRIVVVAASMRAREKTLETLRGVLLIGLPIALLLASAAGYAVAAGALRPVEQMRGRAARISAATSDARLPLPEADDELRRLGETLNEMLERLAAAAENERDFLSTASHELRTPLAILKAEIEFALHPDSAPEEWRGALVSAGEETDRLTRLAEDLLLLARGEQGAAPREVRAVPLAAVTVQVAARMGADVDVAVDPVLRVSADPDALDRALTNLIDNAHRYGAAPIVVSAWADGEWVEIHVADRGDGFAPDYLPRAFERFSRAPGARGGGSGLGLALVEAVAHAHGGTAGAANARPGADVWLRLPRG
jgi:signal transduction histidine kinase